MQNIFNLFRSHRKVSSLLISLLFFVSVFGMISATPGAYASPPPSAQTNTVYLNTSVSYYASEYSSQNATQTITFDQTQGSGNSISLDLSPSTTSTTRVTFSDSFSMEYYSGSGMALYFEISTGETSSGAYSWGTAYANITAPNGDTYSLASYTINSFVSASGNYPWLYSRIIVGTGSIPSQSGTWDLTFALTDDPGYPWVVSDSSFQVLTEDHTSSDEYDVPELSQNTQTWTYQWAFDSQTVTLSLPKYTTAFNIATENAQYSADADYNGATESVPYNFTGSLSATSIEFIPESSPDVSSWTVQYYIYDLYYAVPSSTTQSYSATQSISENQNWWNSTVNFTLSPPSGALSNPSLSTTSGTINAETTMTWSINHILSVGYGTSPPYDEIYYSGNDISSSSFTPSSQYNSISQSSAVVIDSSTGVSYSFDELINYDPAKPTLSASFSGSGSKANLNIVTSEQISGEKENIQINWGDGTLTNLNNVSYGTQPVQSHSYSGTYQGTFSQSETIIVTVTNLPNGNPSGNDQLSTSNSTVYTFGMIDNPTTPNSITRRITYCKQLLIKSSSRRNTG